MIINSESESENRLFSYNFIIEKANAKMLYDYTEVVSHPEINNLAQIEHVNTPGEVEFPNPALFHPPMLFHRAFKEIFLLLNFKPAVTYILDSF